MIKIQKDQVKDKKLATNSTNYNDSYFLTFKLKLSICLVTLGYRPALFNLSNCVIPWIWTLGGSVMYTILLPILFLTQPGGTMIVDIIVLKSNTFYTLLLKTFSIN